MAKGYVIQVGHYSPEEVLVGVPNRNGEPGVNAFKMKKTVGVYPMINRARVWGRRVFDDGSVIVDSVKKTSSPVEVITPGYHGKIEFLEWGSQEVGAHAIEIRYLKNSLSLDYDYQVSVQKIQTDPEGKDGSVFIELEPGENKFDETKDALFVQFLRVYPGNMNSKSKNPDPHIKSYIYYEKYDSAMDLDTVKTIDDALDAGLIVKSLSDDKVALKNMLEMFSKCGVDFGGVDALSGDLDVYKALMSFAAKKTTDFNFWLNDFKKKVSDNFSKAKAFGSIDLTKKGCISVVSGGKKETIFENVDAAGEAMMDAVIENCFEDSVYNGIKKLQSYCDKLGK